MFSFLVPYKLFLQILVIGAVIAGLAYVIHAFLAAERTIGYQKAVGEYTAKQIDAEQTARATEQKLTKQVEDAQNAANLREQDIKKMSVDLATTNRKLRDTTLSVRSKLSTDSCDTVRKAADAALTVFSECTREYTAMAENATGHASDVITLIDAWPD